MRALLIVLVIATIACRAQSFDDIVASNKYIDCADVTFNAVPIIKRLYAASEIDSIYSFLDYWEQKCGLMESAFRLRNILNIRTGHFVADSISEAWIELMMIYRAGLEPYLYPHYPSFMNGINDDLNAMKADFDKLTRLIASETITVGMEESLVLNFYSADAPTFEEIKSAPSHSRLKQLHERIYNKTFRIPEFHISFVTGVSRHFGNISIFGVRPNFGMVMGAKHLRHNYDLLLDFRAGPSKEVYSFVYEGTTLSHRKWTGMYVGFEYTFDLVQRGRTEFGISPGIGYDRITTMTADNDYGEDPSFISSFNSNAGLVFKYRLGKNDGRLGVHLRYNLADYKNLGGTKLDGQYINLRVTIGSVSSPWRDSRLRKLQ